MDTSSDTAKASMKKSSDVELEIMKILIVDDNAANIDVMLTFLEMEGYDISIATSGESAIKAACHNLPDLILLDVMMPQIDGFETCRRLKELPQTKDIPIIFVTAKKEVDDIVKGFDCGGVDYISKPFRQEEVLARVDTHLRLRLMAVAQERLIKELNQALEEVKTLRGILPICSYCKKIRDESGEWQQIEEYISSHSDTDFSHGICSECYNKLDSDGRYK